MNKIIVLTPIKNEEWILRQFLSVTSLFADHIIIADQHSTDSSRAICAEFPKVILIENNSTRFNEAERQILLVEAARNYFKDSKRLLFCLDADEIITADSIANIAVWEKLRNAREGMCFYFEKPEMHKGLTTCSRWKSLYAPLACTDDNTVHKPDQIHSLRIPVRPDKSNTQKIDEIKFMHMAHTRTNVQSAKYRYYSVIENTKKINPFYLRRYNYQSFFDLQSRTDSSLIEATPANWLSDFKLKGINLTDLPDPQYSWHDMEVIRIFNQYGTKQFYLDNIWDFDWEYCRNHGIQHGKLDKDIVPIKTPSGIVKKIGSLVDALYNYYRSIKVRLK